MTALTRFPTLNSDSHFHQHQLICKWLAAAAQHGGDIEAAARHMVQRANTVRLGEPEDIANLAAFIVSPPGRFLQGALIDMDGGQTKTV